MHDGSDIRSVVDSVYRAESRKVLATLARLLRERMSGVLRVIYLLFNEGYSATRGDAIF